MKKGNKAFYLLSLGCPKNDVDSDCLVSELMRSGWHMAGRAQDADVMLVNTCSFIVPAVEESLEAILDLSDLRLDGSRYLVVMGCLVSRYGKKSLTSLLPEVDMFVDFPDYANFTTLMDTLTSKPVMRKAGTGKREYASTLNRGFVYLKIAEGCQRRCSFCSIPSIRGPLRSRNMNGIVEEAAYFVSRGIREIILIAQDTTSYGIDIYGEPSLPTLIEELCKVDGDWRLRVMYLHPEGVNEDVLGAMSNSRVCRYLDLPFQHVDRRILKAMGRKGDAGSHRDLIESANAIMGEVAIRATFMVGFPGEDRQAFDRLRDFVAGMRFDWLGLFSYSHEEGTPAYSLGKGASRTVARERLGELSGLQEEIMREKARKMIGRRLRVLLECESDEAAGYWEARSQREAPEIDGIIFIPHEEGLRPGSLREARITASEGIDLIGIVESA